MVHVLMEPHGWKRACFTNIASITFTGNATEALRFLLLIIFQSSFHEWNPKSVISFEDFPNVTLIPYTSELLQKHLHAWDLHRVQRLLLWIRIIAIVGKINLVNETLRITTPRLHLRLLKLIKHILSFSAHGEVLLTRLGIKPLLTCRWLELRVR